MKKQVSEQTKIDILLKALKSIYSTKDKRFLIASLLLHVVIFSMLLVSWQSSEAVKIHTVPNSVQARVISLDELKALRSKRELEQKKIEDKKKSLAKKKKEALQKKELKRKKALKRKQELKKKEALAKKQKEAQRKAVEQKKILIQKKEKEKKDKLKKEAEQKAAERKEVERLAAEKKKLELEKRKEREQKLLDKMLQAEKERESALEKELEAERVAQEQSRLQEQALAQELSETEKFLSLIKTRVVNQWHIPPKSEGLSVVLQIRLLPTGELSSVRIIEKSGVHAFDQSAENAARGVRKYPVPEKREIFEKNFRVFSMRFAPS